MLFLYFATFFIIRALLCSLKSGGNMNPMLNIAIRAARKAGNIIAKGYEQSPQDTQVLQKIRMIM